MPTLHRLDGSRVLLYPDDHPPPHVHVKLRDGRECTVDLETFDLRGRVREREIREVMTWIASNQERLMNEWWRYNS